VIASGVIGKTHKSVLGFLYPIKITLPLYITWHTLSLNTTIHPTLHSMRIPIREERREVGDDVSLENIWEPWQFEDTNVDLTTFPSGELMLRGFVMGLIFFMGVRPFHTDVAPVSATYHVLGVLLASGGVRPKPPLSAFLWIQKQFSRPTLAHRCPRATLGGRIPPFPPFHSGRQYAESHLRMCDQFK
jgi:hypothetical protein